MYTWELRDWPKYQFDQQRAQFHDRVHTIAAARNQGAVRSLNEKPGLETQIDLLVDAAIETSAIEGERINRDDVRSSIRNHFLHPDQRIPVHDPIAAGVAALILETREQFDQPLTAAMLDHWQSLVIPGSLQQGQQATQPPVPSWRTHPEPMQIVSGTINRPTIHYEAPPSYRVPDEMSRFLVWYNGESRQLPGVARAAIAHLWFETIHPYEDGNGRVGRAIADKALSESLGEPSVISIAAVISRHRKAYYAHLNRASKDSLQVDDWVEWFSQCAIESQRVAEDAVQHVIDKARFWERADTQKINARQRKVIGKLLDAGPDGFEGGMSASKYQAITKASKATATRDLQDLVAKGLLLPIHAKGRHARYQLDMPGRPSNPLLEDLRRLQDRSGAAHSPPDGYKPTLS